MAPQKQLMAELSLAGSTCQNVRDGVPTTVKCCKFDPSSNRHQVSATRKRKSAELNEVLNNAHVIFHKGDAPERFNCQIEKDWKLVSSRARLCGSILQKLMTHRNGWVFNHPADPLKLNIPDYFSIIAKPMDLGTIKTKLEKQMYSTANQFAADVKLVFSNAMTYNPSCTKVHVMAKELDRRFSEEWEMTELKWRKESTLPTQTMMKRKHKETIASEHEIKREVSLNSISHSTRFHKPAEMLNFKKDPKKVSLPKNASLIGLNKGNICIQIDNVTEGTLWKKNHIMKVNTNGRPLKTVNGVEKSAKRSSKNFIKGLESEVSICLDNFTNESKTIDTIQNEFNYRDTAQRDEERSHLDGEQGEAHCEMQFSPSKALRVAKLKCRFADTILKACEELQNNGEKLDSCRTQQDREKLFKKYQEEKERIEAQAKNAAQKVESDLKMKIEKEREASRLALQKIETSVIIDDFNHVVKELADLGYNEPLNFLISNDMSSFTNPLRQLGLFIKRDDDDYDNEDIY